MATEKKLSKRGQLAKDLKNHFKAQLNIVEEILLLPLEDQMWVASKMEKFQKDFDAKIAELQNKNDDLPF
jgi:CO dehydrogenase/acetyl-CoA synthase beta subunit